MTELQRWADAQQYRSEEMPFNTGKGPRVTLLNATPDPLGSIAAMCAMYEGRVVRSLEEVTRAQRAEAWEAMGKTHLKAPLEAVQLHFLVEGVNRNFTHQMVRQRTACFSQESLRFAVKENLDEEIPLPPSLAGLPEEDPRVRVWHKAVNSLDDAYSFLVSHGTPAEEARDLLPTGVTTRLHYITNLRGLLEHAGNRLCTQAQFSWRLVMSEIRRAMREYGGNQGAFVHSFPEGAVPHWMPAEDAWQWDVISEALKPICYQTGKCEFKAKFDRSCSIRERVDANAALGRPSSEWGERSIGPEEMPIIEPILPQEWLCDPGAARKL